MCTWSGRAKGQLLCVSGWSNSSSDAGDSAASHPRPCSPPADATYARRVGDSGESGVFSAQIGRKGLGIPFLVRGTARA